MKRYILIVILSTSLLTVSNAQDGSPTPAPSKTPEMAATSEQIETNDEALSNYQGPFIQEDLEVIVGNVQRPNGIVWYDGFLFTACNGDWTIYRIDDTTGETITYIFGVQDSHSMFAEQSSTGFNVWIPDFAQDRLFVIDESRTAPVSVTSENLNGPWGIAQLDANHFLVSNLKANNIVQISRDGEVTMFLEDLRNPAGIVTSEEHLYLANNGSARRAIEWVDLGDPDLETKSLVSGLQGASGLLLGPDGYLYFTFSLGNRGVVGRVNPEDCLDKECQQDDVDIVLFSELPAPLSGLSISPDGRLFVHTIYRSEIYWVDLYQ